MYVIDTQNERSVIDTQNKNVCDRYTKVNMRMVDTQNENVCDRYTKVNEESVIDTLKKWS